MLAPVRLSCHREPRLSQNGKFHSLLSANSPRTVNHPERPLPFLISRGLESTPLPAHPTEGLPVKPRPHLDGRTVPLRRVAIRLLALCTGRPSILHPPPYPPHFTKRPLFLLQRMRRPSVMIGPTLIDNRIYALKGLFGFPMTKQVSGLY